MHEYSWHTREMIYSTVHFFSMGDIFTFFRFSTVIYLTFFNLQALLRVRDTVNKETWKKYCEVKRKQKKITETNNITLHTIEEKKNSIRKKQYQQQT